MRTLSCLMLSLMLYGCASVNVAPPLNLLQDCHVSTLPDGTLTLKDIYDHVLNLQEDLSLCNADKQALRNWYQ